MDNTTIPWWRGLWCMQQTLPYALDTGTLTALEILNKLVLVVNNLVNDLGSTSETVQDLIDQIREIDKQLEEMDKIYRDFLDGKVPLSYIEGISKWLDLNLQCVVNRTVKFFSFGIDDDGRVYVDMPYTWYWLKLSWDMEYGSDTFGHIELNW